MYIRTLWAYQLTCLSLREGSSAQSQARLSKFRLPLANEDVVFDYRRPEQYLVSMNVPQTTNLFSLFVYITDIWTDCSAWIFKGVRNHSREAPWDHTSEWSRLNNRIETFEAQLGPKQKFSRVNLDAHFELGEGSLYCYFLLVTYAAKVLIRRIFFPFVPLDKQGPKGPYPLPHELRGAPLSWWSENAHIVFESCKVMSILFHELDKRNQYFCNPFSGFCGLTAASMLIYITNFPSYDPLFKDSPLYYDYCAAF
ncbi:hypothetical protein KL906_003551 [Ogataea polymorpha]|nr:hypothetical protein KL906_003551 [Ogataea polymorpha]KAG7916717.1 hypothetical protein KL927_003356 [Ogataea polymorpha]